MAQAKNRKRTPAESPTEPKAGPAGWLKGLLSVWIAWHLFAVFVSPFSVPPSSQLAVDVAQSRLVRWYTDPLYLNHGYHFFGPEPPVNHLVRYTVWDTGGAVIAEGEFPNTDQQWPRLLYHRHMMLADQANLAPSENGPEDAVRRSLRAYAHHLLRRHGGAETRIDYVRHLPLSPMQVDSGADPNAPEMFATTTTVRQTSADLPPPVRPEPTPEPIDQGVGG